MPVVEVVDEEEVFDRSLWGKLWTTYRGIEEKLKAIDFTIWGGLAEEKRGKKKIVSWAHSGIFQIIKHNYYLFKTKERNIVPSLNDFEIRYDEKGDVVFTLRVNTLRELNLARRLTKLLTGDFNCLIVKTFE